MQHDSRRFRFLLRPFWRDWVLAGVLIAVGFMMGDFRMPERGAYRLIYVGVAWTFLIAGGCIFLAAIGHAAWRVVHVLRDRHRAA